MIEKTSTYEGTNIGERERRVPVWRQSRLREFTPAADVCVHENILPFGDPLTPRREADGIFRASFQNIRGTTITKGLGVPDEIDAMDELGIDAGVLARRTNRGLQGTGGGMTTS